MRLGLFTLWSIAAAGGCQIEKRPPAPPADSTAAVPAAPAAPATPPPPPPAPAATKIMAVEGFLTPESVLHDTVQDIYFVSNINGSPTAKDNNGFISRVKPDEIGRAHV